MTKAEGLLEPVEDEDEADMEAPLELLNSVATRLLSGDIPASSSRLQSLFLHIQSVVGDVVEASFEKITGALDQVDEAKEALSEEFAEDEGSKEILQEFELGRAFIEESLAVMQESFFSAKSLDDLEHFEEQFREAEIQLAEGLGRLETAVIQVEHSELAHLSGAPPSEHIENALESFAFCLETLSTYLESGDTSRLELVLDQIDLAKDHVEAAYEEADLLEEAKQKEAEMAN